MAAKNERALIELFAPAAPEALGSTASARFANCRNDVPVCRRGDSYRVRTDRASAA